MDQNRGFVESGVEGMILRRYYASRGDTFPGISSAIIAHSGKSIPAFLALPKIYFPLILLAPMKIGDDLSRIFREFHTC